MGPVIPYRVLFGLLTGVFAARVAAQFVLQGRPLSFLPPFAMWHSATMPYGTLLAIQLLILAGMGLAVVRVPSTARPRLGQVLLAVGWIYGLVMASRMIVGVLELSSHPWFDGALSTAFHFGLAAFMLVLGSAWGGRAPFIRRLARSVTYPALMAGGVGLFVWLRQTGSPLLFASYLSVLIASLGVLLHETFAPARQDWRPTSHDVLRDGVFLTLVQVALPAILKVATLALIVALLDTDIAPFGPYWPHQAPIALQVAGMLVIAELFRYWLHRILHEVDALWRLHAVHHAANKLYTVNVGRFHPFDKSLQFLGDTLPFVLLGVAPEAFASYFVVYAVNGFYQHSNADVRLGPLNWIIAGPELHRWHHSTEIAEGHSNYGNNLIVWDAVFGTRLLPADRTVDRIGIGNPAWPDGFLAQMTAPFTIATEAPTPSKVPASR